MGQMRYRCYRFPLHFNLIKNNKDIFLIERQENKKEIISKMFSTSILLCIAFGRMYCFLLNYINPSCFSLSICISIVHNNGKYEIKRKKSFLFFRRGNSTRLPFLVETHFFTY